MKSRIAGKKSPKHAKNLSLLEKSVELLEKGTMASEIEMDGEE